MEAAEKETLEKIRAVSEAHKEFKKKLTGMTDAFRARVEAHSNDLSLICASQLQISICDDQKNAVLSTLLAYAPPELIKNTRTLIETLTEKRIESTLETFAGACRLAGVGNEELLSLGGDLIDILEAQSNGVNSMISKVATIRQKETNHG